jgi:hypothetical protein
MTAAETHAHEREPDSSDKPNDHVHALGVPSRDRKRRLAILIPLLLFASTFVIAYALAPGMNGELEVRALAVDRTAGSEKWRVIIENRGSDDVTLLQVEPTCECVSIVGESRQGRLRQGEQATYQILIGARPPSDLIVPGVLVHSDDVMRPERWVTFD